MRTREICVAFSLHFVAREASGEPATWRRARDIAARIEGSV
jgi:hypothetical protein